MSETEDNILLRHGERARFLSRLIRTPESSPLLTPGSAVCSVAHGMIASHQQAIMAAQLCAMWLMKPEFMPA